MTDGVRPPRAKARRPPEVLNYNHLYYFHVAATERSVARAAERLGVTQPTVSEQVRQLERALDVTLFERARAGIRLTEAGRQAFAHTSVMFQEGERLIETLGRAPLIEAATLRVGMSFQVSRSVEPDFLFTLIELEGCVPAVHHAEPPDLLHALRNRELDLVLVESVPVVAAREKLQVVEVGRARLIVVARDPIEPKRSWNGASIIQYGQSILRGEVASYLDERGLKPTIIASTDDPLLMLEAATRGACVAFVPESVARQAIIAGRVHVLASLEPGPVTLYAVHHATAARDLVRRAVSALIDGARP